MVRPTKFVEFKFCKSCHKELEYINFRIVKPLTKGPNKGKLVAWTDIKGGKRFSKCKDCEKNRARDRYLDNPIPQMLSNSRIRAQKKVFHITLTHLI